MKALAFTGAHSTGKSTLIREYVTQHAALRISVIEGLTRAIIERGFALAKGSTMDSFANYMRDQLRAERLIGNATPDVLLADRVVIDAASYATVNARLLYSSVPSYFIDMILEVALLEASRFDLFVYCPVEFPMEPNEVRPTDELYREMVGLQIKAFLDEFRIPYVTASGDVQTRLGTVSAALGELHG